MDRYRLKNIIILILLLVNGFLLGSLALRQTSEHASRHQTMEQLASLFAADGMTLDLNGVSTEAAPSPLSLTRSTEREREAAAFFLGKNPQQTDEGGEIYSYAGKQGGVAKFRANGSFDIAGTLSDENGPALCREFCREFSYSDPIFVLDDNGTGSATADCSYNKLTVRGGTVTFTFDHGVLMAVSGTLLPENGTPDTSGPEPLSAAAALTAFQKMRRERQVVVSSVTEVLPCYELQNTAADPMSLVPAWCVVTDTAKYYVNCMTGAVDAG